jgi:hypothetical protein
MKKIKKTGLVKKIKTPISDAFKKWLKMATTEDKQKLCDDAKVLAKVLAKPTMKVVTSFFKGGEQLTPEEIEARKKLLAVNSGIPVVAPRSKPKVIKAKLSATEIKRRKKALAGYVKPDTLVAQKNLKAQWAFPVARLEEFLSIFQQSVFNVAVKRLRGDAEDYVADMKISATTEPAENPVGEKHDVDARVFITAFQNAVLHANGFRSAPEYCEVDYYFWISKGTVFFGCVLPGTEKSNLEGFNKCNKAGPKWLKTPPEIVKNGVRASQFCPEGTIASYVRLLSFKPGRMVGVQEVANRMVKNPKERAWAIKYVLNMLATERKCNRTILRSLQVWGG